MSSSRFISSSAAWDSSTQLRGCANSRRIQRIHVRLKLLKTRCVTIEENTIFYFLINWIVSLSEERRSTRMCSNVLPDGFQHPSPKAEAAETQQQLWCNISMNVQLLTGTRGGGRIRLACKCSGISSWYGQTQSATDAPLSCQTASEETTSSTSPVCCIVGYAICLYRPSEARA